MDFPFRLPKAIQALALLAKSYKSQQIYYLRAIKLLYIAERESLKEIGRPIIGDRVFAMKNGPVLSTVLNYIQGKRHSSIWSNTFRKDGHFLTLVSDPGDDALSEYEIEKLKSIEKRFEDLTRWKICDLTHEFPEWRQYDPGESSRRIPLTAILHALQCTPEQIKAILEEATYEKHIDSVLGSPIS